MALVVIDNSSSSSDGRNNTISSDHADDQDSGQRQHLSKLIRGAKVMIDIVQLVRQVMDTTSPDGDEHTNAACTTTSDIITSHQQKNCSISVQTLNNLLKWADMVQALASQYNDRDLSEALLRKVEETECSGCNTLFSPHVCIGSVTPLSCLSDSA